MVMGAPVPLVLRVTLVPRITLSLMVIGLLGVMIFAFRVVVFPEPSIVTEPLPEPIKGLFNAKSAFSDQMVRGSLNKKEPIRFTVPVSPGRPKSICEKPPVLNAFRVVKVSVSGLLVDSA